jgi:TaqI-like C-terminal specificity domain
VTQPCFALIATPRAADQAAEDEPGRSWILSERQRLAGAAAEIEVPEVLRALAKGPSLPPELFGEMGFQTTRVVSEQLLCRLPEPPPEYSYPLLEGRDVSEFRQREPRLFLKPDAELLKRAHCRLRPQPAYEAVRFVVRQTAKVTIAALHSGAPFRNTLLAGFMMPGFSPELCVGLLNSALYRAFHLSLRRDARQAVFPQVKIGHLRALPCPPEDPAARGRVAELTLQATRHGIDVELRRALDCAVFDLFRSSLADRGQIGAFLEARAPELGHAAPC